jgi:hypothetical protein
MVMKLHIRPKHHKLMLQTHQFLTEIVRFDKVPLQPFIISVKQRFAGFFTYSAGKMLLLKVISQGLFVEIAVFAEKTLRVAWAEVVPGHNVLIQVSRGKKPLFA